MVNGQWTSHAGGQIITTIDWSFQIEIHYRDDAASVRMEEGQKYSTSSTNAARPNSSTSVTNSSSLASSTTAIDDIQVRLESLNRISHLLPTKEVERKRKEIRDAL